MFGWNSKKDDIFTAGLPNGYWIDRTDKRTIEIYILGVADGRIGTREKITDPLCRDNPSLTRENIVEAVKEYYQRRPENKFRQIAAVIRSGCVN